MPVEGSIIGTMPIQTPTDKLPVVEPVMTIQPIVNPGFSFGSGSVVSQPQRPSILPAVMPVGADIISLIPVERPGQLPIESGSAVGVQPVVKPGFSFGEASLGSQKPSILPGVELVDGSVVGVAPVQKPTDKLPIGPIAAIQPIVNPGFSFGEASLGSQRPSILPGVMPVEGSFTGLNPARPSILPGVGLVDGSVVGVAPVQKPTDKLPIGPIAAIQPIVNPGFSFGEASLGSQKPSILPGVMPVEGSIIGTMPIQTPTDKLPVVEPVMTIQPIVNPGFSFGGANLGSGMGIMPVEQPESDSSFQVGLMPIEGSIVGVAPVQKPTDKLPVGPVGAIQPIVNPGFSFETGVIVSQPQRPSISPIVMPIDASDAVVGIRPRPEEQPIQEEMAGPLFGFGGVSMGATHPQKPSILPAVMPVEGSFTGLNPARPSILPGVGLVDGSVVGVAPVQSPTNKLPVVEAHSGNAWIIF